MAKKHRAKKKEDRRGWFQKGDKDKGEANPPIPNYVRSCKTGGRGYLGPRFEAHHIIPQTSVERSIQEAGKDLQYITDIQYVTDWNINSQINLMGLPHYHAYDLYYQQKTRLELQGGEGEAIRGMVSYFNSFKAKSRRRWLGQIKKVSPEAHPIHNPVSWGHVDYDEELVKELKKYVWNKINDKRKEHDVDAEKVAGALNAVADMNYEYLLGRAKGVSKELWARRIDPADNRWYKPFTMMDIPNPLFG